MISGLALFMPPVALYELSRVDAVRSWQPVEMELLGVAEKDNGSRRGGTTWVWSFREPATGRVVEARDFEPGDLPWSGPGWSTMEGKARAWQRLTGRRVTVWMAPDGRSVYPAQGSKGTMAVVLLLCGAWWLVIAAKPWRAS